MQHGDSRAPLNSLLSLLGSPNNNIVPSAGIVSQFTGTPGMIGMHGGLPPPDAFPFATLGGALAPDTTSSTGHNAAAAPASDKAGGCQLQGLQVTDPLLVAAAQQYMFTPKVRKQPISQCILNA